MQSPTRAAGRATNKLGGTSALVQRQLSEHPTPRHAGSRILDVQMARAEVGLPEHVEAAAAPSVGPRVCDVDLSVFQGEVPTGEHTSTVATHRCIQHLQASARHDGFLLNVHAATPKMSTPTPESFLRAAKRAVALGPTVLQRHGAVPKIEASNPKAAASATTCLALQGLLRPGELLLRSPTSSWSSWKRVLRVLRHHRKILRIDFDSGVKDLHRPSALEELAADVESAAGPLGTAARELDRCTEDGEGLRDPNRAAEQSFAVLEVQSAFSNRHAALPNTDGPAFSTKPGVGGSSASFRCHSSRFSAIAEAHGKRIHLDGQGAFGNSNTGARPEVPAHRHEIHISRQRGLALNHNAVVQLDF
mmetsp:Transcript_2327/g.5521  ORF Transcript_2327/g.5521 Transcript_2327/m.5521 type:complete len:362 (+) Transcript_2327:2824-3909(+)